MTGSILQVLSQLGAHQIMDLDHGQLVVLEIDTGDLQWVGMDTY